MRRDLVASVLAAASIAVGCGELGPEESSSTTTKAAERSPLTQRDVEKLEPDSPARTVLAWWRALQFGNPGGAAELYAPATGVTAEQLNRQLRYAPKYFNFAARPVVEGVKDRGAVATVSLLLRSTASSEGSTEVVERPLAIRVARVGDRWRLADNLYIERLVADAQLREQMELIELRTRAGG